MGNDRARHAGAVRMGLLRLADGIELLRDVTFEIGMVDIDLRIDDRHRDVVSLELAMDTDQTELADRVLGGIALAVGAAGEIGILRKLGDIGGGMVLDQVVGVVGLRAGDDLVTGQRLDHRGDRSAVADMHPIGGDADEAHALRSQDAQPQADP